MNQPNQNVPIAKDTGSIVIKRVDELCQLGFTMPSDYNYVNAIKASMLVLSDVKDRNQRPALEVCTQASIQQSLFAMASKGLDVSKKQAYFICRGNQLCLHESYFGKVTQVKRIFPDWEPQPRVIYEGDDFAYETDIKTGRRILTRHEQSLASLDADFIGAYLYLPCKDGGKDLYVMSKKMIMTAWMKSSNKSLSTHKEFTDKMVCKTIVNSACNMIINSTPDASQFATDEDFESEHTPIDVPSHEIVDVDMDNAPMQEARPVETKPTNEVPPIKDDVDF